MMQITKTLSAGVLNLRLEGDLAMESGREFQDACKEWPPGTRQVVLECAGLAFVDSTGTHDLLTAGIRWRTAGLRVKFEHLSPELTEMLGTLGFFEALGTDGPEAGMGPGDTPGRDN